MSTAQNIGVVDATSLSTNQAYFNNYSAGTVSSDQNSALVGYFEEFTNGNKAAAQTLASAVIYTSLAQGVDPMSTLTQFTMLPKGQLNAYLTTFLNLNRVGTSLLGLNNQPLISKYVSRAILI